VLVGAVSVHDAILVVLHDDVIDEMEANPLGKWLLELQGGEVWLFVLLKLVGTAFVGATLIMLYSRHRRMAISVAGALAVFQLLLLGYLLWA
jgi:hypothetical protein